MPQNHTDDKSALVQVTVWCRPEKNIACANVDPDLCRRLVSLGVNEFS